MTADILLTMPADPDRVAVVYLGRPVTYGEIAAVGERVTSAVERHGARGRVVGVPAERSVDFVARMIGVWNAGAIPAILGQWHADRVRSALASVGAAASFRPISAPDLLEPAHPARHALPASGASHILFTSGTTGAPKGIVVGRPAFEAASLAFFRGMPIGESDQVAFLSRPGHDPSLRELLAPWLTGATLVIPDKATVSDPRLVAAWIERNSVTVLQGTPVFLQLLADAASRPLEGLRLVCSVGARFNAVAFSSAARLAPRATIVNCYGASETPQVVCAHRMPAGCDAPNLESVPIGRPLGHAVVKVVPVDGYGYSEGVLHVEASACALGYTDGAPLRVADREGRLWYDTGDIVRELPDGSLLYLRRKDRQVQVNGARVELAEIESEAGRMGGVIEAAAKLVEGDRGFGSVHLTVVRRPGTAVDVDGLDAALRRHLDPAVVPSAIEVRDSWEDGGGAPAAGGTGREALMRQLQECARSALGSGQVDPDAGFFEAGFTSMTLMRFVSEAALRLDMEIFPVLVFRYPTLNALADYLEKRTS